MTDRPLENVKDCILIGRQWMKRTHAYRISVELPNDEGMTAAVLTRLMQSQVAVRVTGDDAPTEGFELVIDPAYLSDVRQKGRKWVADIDTVMETQNGIGPEATIMVGHPVIFTVSPPTKPGDGSEVERATESDFKAPAPAPAPVKADLIDNKDKARLHAELFVSEIFWQCMKEKTGLDVFDDKSAKIAFRHHMGVASTRDITKQQLADWYVREYTEWIHNRRSR